MKPAQLRDEDFYLSSVTVTTARGSQGQKHNADRFQTKF